jgi:hypothetical protein
VRVLTAALIIAVLLLVSFGASAQELRLYSVEEGVAVACKGDQLMTAEERRHYEEDLRKLGGDPHRIVRTGIYMSLVRVTGPFPFKVSELRFNNKVHPIAKTLVEETFQGFRFDSSGQPLTIEEACGTPTPTHATTPKLIVDRLGLELKSENVAALVKGTAGNSTVMSRGIVLATAGYIGPIAMRWPVSIRTAALDIRMTLESGRVGLCYEIVSNPVTDAQWLWRRIIPDTAPLKIVDCTLARQAPSQPSQPSTPDR